MGWSRYGRTRSCMLPMSADFVGRAWRVHAAVHSALVTRGLIEPILCVLQRADPEYVA